MSLDGSSSSNSSASPVRSDANARLSDTSNTAVVAASRSGRRPARRQGHVKSRMGCYTCKTRRVKCNELRPQCSSCRRLALDCSYPPIPTAARRVVHAGPPILSHEDLRFYYQFISTAFPAFPLRATEGWMDCAAMTYKVQRPDLP